MAQEYKLRGLSALDLSNGEKREVEIEACFNVETGDIEDAPALDPLAKFDIVERGGAVYIKGDETTIRSNRRQPQVKCSAQGQEKVVIVGG
ncbi:MAG: hypothetical protein Q9214_007015 [Letrouitia sp. 1 TL-2023]